MGLEDGLEGGLGGGFGWGFEENSLGYTPGVFTVLPTFSSSATGFWSTSASRTGTAASALPGFGASGLGSALSATDLQSINPDSTRLVVRHFPRVNGLLGAGTPVYGARSKQFLREKSAPGSFSVELPVNHFSLNGISDGDYLQYVLDGAVVFTGIYDRDKAVVKHPKNEAEQVTTLSGMSTLAEWEDAIVFGPTPIGSDLEGQVRYFDWSSPELDTSNWITPTALFRLHEAMDAVGEVKSGRPVGHIDNNGYWIWSTGHSGDFLYEPGVSPFRTQFAVPAAGLVAIYIGCDDGFVARVDGVDIGGNNRVSGWENVWRVDVELDAGIHDLCILAENYERDSTSTNGAGLIASVSIDHPWEHEVGGVLLQQEETLLNRSQVDGWKTLHYPEVLPGFTSGTVIRVLFEENGLDAKGWTLDFSDTHDSAGAEWEPDQSFTFEVGRSLLDVLDQMATTSIDYVIDRASKTLHAYNIDTAGSSASIGDLSSAIVNLGAERRGQIKNVLLVRDAKGTFTVRDEASISEHGERWGYLTLGKVEDRSESRRMANKEVKSLADPRDAVTSMLAGEILAGLGKDPILDWDVGDYLTLRNRRSQAEDYRALGIAVAEDEYARLDVTPLLNDRRTQESVRIQRALERLERGNLNGRSLISSPPQEGSGVELRRGEMDTIDISWPGPWADSVFLDKKAGPLKISGTGRWVWCEYEWDEAPVSDVEIAVLVDGVAVAGHVLPANTKTVHIFPSLLTNRTAFTLQVIDDDILAEGLTARWHFLRFI